MRYSNNRATALSLLVAGALTFFGGCVADPSAPVGGPHVIEAKPVSSVTITLDKSTLAPGEQAQAAVSARTSDGTAVSEAIDYLSKNPSIATVSSKGLVTAIASGVAVIQATVGGCVGITSVTVKSLNSLVALVAVALDSSSIRVGHTTKASAIAKDSAGNVVSGETVSWTSMTPLVATVSSAGDVTAVAAGTATIKGTVGTTWGTATLTVLSVSQMTTVTVTIDSTTLGVGHTGHASAVAKDGSGNTITGQTVTWTSLNPSIATVSGSGVVTAVAAGSATIQATVLGTNGTTVVAVIAPPDLASHNFDDGTWGVYTGIDLPLDEDIVDDPTSSGRGKVARFHYAGANQDRNRSLQFAHALRFGQTMYSRGEFYVDSQAGASDGLYQRKLLYWQPHVDYLKYGSSGRGGPVFWMYVLLRGSSLYAGGGYVGLDGSFHEVLPPIATVSLQRWYTIETRVTMESAIGAGDGTLQVWLDGNLIYTNNNMRWSEPAWIGQPVAGGNGTLLDINDVYFERYLVGEQVNFGGSFDEYRYWDNVAFSTTRIGR